MGEKLNATNVIDNLILTIITSIALDHMEYHGLNVEIIADEKAVIIKRNVPCVTASQEKSIMNTLEQYTVNKKSSLYRGEVEWNCKTE
ncbi:MAG: hypothetical protein ACR5K2_02140 [Wolbachia sp.]